MSGRFCLLAGALLTLVTVTGAVRAGEASITIAGIDGRALKPFEPAGAANVIVFVATDCPISNGYAPEIQRVCRDYAGRGVGCTLMYEDVETTPGELDARVRTHLREYGYRNVPAAVDRTRTIATHAKASITPQAVVIDRRGQVRYRGRIDNFYAALGKPRQQVTEHDLRNALDDLLAGRPIAKPEMPALGCHIVGPDFSRK
jgi:hypothetical protein